MSNSSNTGNSNSTTSNTNTSSNVLSLLQSLVNNQKQQKESDVKKKKNDYFFTDLFEIEDKIQYCLKDNLSKKATNIVFIEGLPIDASEREISHILRPFPGFRSCRIKETKKEQNGKKNLICFGDFDEVYQATICINTLQGYRFDKNDIVGLHFGYGVNRHNNQPDNRNNNEKNDKNYRNRNDKNNRNDRGTK